MREEGWYVDPYGLHDGRWFSDGTPTGLVRDGGVESKDPPPDSPFEGRPEPIEVGGDDLVDRSENHTSPGGNPGVEAAWEAFIETGGD